MDFKFLNSLLVFFKSSPQISDSIRQWTTNPELLAGAFSTSGVRFLLAGTLSFVAAAISSAGGVGGGGIFVPILTVVAGLDVKTASSYSAFMVTGGAIANVACHVFDGSRAGALIDYDIALLSEPSMLLGVSGGVVLNQVLPEWLIVVAFVAFIGFCAFRTCMSGLSYWRLESRRRRRRSEEDGVESTEKPLLAEELKVGFPWRKLGILVVIWVSFFAVNLLKGNRYGQGIMNIEFCGEGYWMMSLLQIPLAIVFTSWILFRRQGLKNNASTDQQEDRGLTQSHPSRKLIFPVMALLAGVLGGVFGIGGGMLISPFLLQIGIEPEVTAATCSFMVLFSSAMSAVQYLLLGMEQIYGAIALAAVCSIASWVGLTLVQAAILKHGRVSLIVFAIGTVMALSTVLMTSFGAVEAWRDYKSGQGMGFKNPC